MCIRDSANSVNAQLLALEDGLARPAAQSAGPQNGGPPFAGALALGGVPSPNFSGGGGSGSRRSSRW
eukprot:9232092-Alexandrium_andersonii.AAC.1